MASVETEGRSSTIAPGTGGHVPFVSGLAGHGDAPALLSDAATLSYRELAERVAQVAERLGTTRRLVLLSPTNDVSSLVTYLAALHGGHPVLLSPTGDRRRLAELVAAYDPDVVVAEPGGELRERRPGTTHELHPDLALLLSTSGSTGSPRLVRLSHENLQANADAIAGALGTRPTDRAVTTLPLHYCYGLSVVHSHLARGAALVLGDDSVVEPAYWDRFRRFGGTSLAGVPYTFEQLERVGVDRLDVPSLRQVTQAGGRMAPDRVRRFALLGRRMGWDLVVMYGQTEATARMAVLPSDLVPEHPASIGHPVPGGSFRIDAPDAEGRGELVYEGPNVMLGYAQHASDLARGRTVTELRTGDLARRNDVGLYEIVGRAARFVKLYGHRIELDRVEQVLGDHGHDVVCTGDDDHLVLAVRRADRTDELHRVAADRFGLPQRAVRMVVYDEIPRLANGKPDLPAILRAASSLPEPHVAVEAPGGSGGRVRAVMASVLGLDDVPDDASFVDLGGDSLSYVEASIRLEAVLGTLPTDWHLRTVAELESCAPVRRVLPRMEVNVVLRALAIVAMVTGHVGVAPLRGGAHLLLAVAGFNFARFGLGARDTGEQLRRVRSNLARIAVPSLAFVGASVVLDDRFTLANLVLVNHHVGSGEWRYWFIEVLVQVLVLLGGIFAVPRVLVAERRRPFLFALGVLAVALVAREALTDLGDPGYRTFTTQAAAWLFALGWAVQRAVTVPQRLLVTGIALVTVPGFFQVEWRGEIVLAGVLALVWLRSVRVPHVLNRVLGLIAGASLYIYLSHWHVHRELDRAAGPIVAIAGSLAVGVALWKAAEALRNARRTRSGASVGWGARTA